MIPLWMGERVYEAAREPKEFYLIRGSAHNDTYIAGGEEYFTKLKDFIGRLR